MKRSLIGLWLIACGGGGASTTLLTITPSTDAKHVTPDSLVTLAFSGPLDASTVDEANIRIFYGSSQVRTAPATVAYDDTAHTVTLTPYALLQIRQDFTIKWTGLKASGGAAVADGSSLFRTINNNLVSVLTYDDSGVANGGVVQTIDDNGEVVESRTSSGAGPDGVWATDDDPDSDYYDQVIGADGTRSLAEYSAGPDGVVGTADDTLTGCEVIKYGPFGYTQNINLTPGPDGACGTADDVTTDATVLTYGANDQVSRYLYSTPGSDGIPSTADDVYHAHIEYSYDDPLATRQVVFAAGPDGLLNTDDDVPSSYAETQLDVHGVPQELDRFDGPGVDGIWFTDDDHVADYSVYTYASDRTIPEQLYYTPGPDGIAFTADDQTEIYYKTAYSNGAIATQAFFSSGGADGIWLTTDDLPTRVIVCSTTR